MDHYDKPSPQTYLVLAHHGIKGQRWGVRRYQNEDGTWTEAGKKRYGVDIDGAKKKVQDAKIAEKQALKAYYRDTGYGSIYNEAAQKKLNKAVTMRNLAERDLADEKIKDKLNSETKKSKRRINLEKQYIEKGLTEEEAEIQAYKRARTEKILAATAGMTVAAVTAYAAYKYHEKTADKLIEPGTLLQRISRDDNMGVRDAFYSSMTGSDNTKYRGIYGRQLESIGGKVFEKKIGVTDAMKVASESSATKALSDLVRSDATYAKALEQHLTDSMGRYVNDKQNGVIRKGLESLKKGKVDSKVYEALNMTLVDHTLGTSDTIHKGFYNKLKSLGYDAIIDVNDKKYSGYMTKNPLITFNTAKTTVQSIREVRHDEVAKAAVKGYMDISIKTLLPQVAGTAGLAALATAGTNSLTNRSDDEIVRRYRSEHPDSALSYTDILRNEKG